MNRGLGPVMMYHVSSYSARSSFVTMSLAAVADPPSGVVHVYAAKGGELVASMDEGLDVAAQLHEGAEFKDLGDLTNTCKMLAARQNFNVRNHYRTMRGSGDGKSNFHNTHQRGHFYCTGPIMPAGARGRDTPRSNLYWFFLDPSHCGFSTVTLAQ